MRAFDEEVELASAQIAPAQRAPAPLAEHLVRTHGTGWRTVWGMAARDTSLASPVVPTLPYIVAELHFAVEQEMALTLGDLLIRRLHVAFETRDHGLAAAPSVAQAVAPLLGWSEKDCVIQLEAYREEIRRIFEIEQSA